MKIAEPSPAAVARAIDGSLAAIDEVIATIQPGVYNLCVRMLGNRDDAADAAQEILIKVVTHLSTFRSDSAFSTWIYRIAHNHLLNSLTRSKEYPLLSTDVMAAKLSKGLAYGEQYGGDMGNAKSLSPEDKAEARQIALACTQNMLMTLDREHRLAYVLDVVFGLSSNEAADVAGIKPDAFRQRLSRARTKLEQFTGQHCGLANPEAACRCEKQVPAMRASQERVGMFVVHRAEQIEASKHFDALLRMSEAAALFRAHPEYHAPESMRESIRAVLQSEGYWRDDGARH